MASKIKKRSKLGMLLDMHGLKLSEFAQLVYERTGYVIHVTNLNNFCTGLKSIRAVKTALYFAQTLGVSIEDIIDENDYKIN